MCRPCQKSCRRCSAPRARGCSPRPVLRLFGLRTRPAQPSTPGTATSLKRCRSCFLSTFPLPDSGRLQNDRCTRAPYIGQAVTDSSARPVRLWLRLERPNATSFLVAAVSPVATTASRTSERDNSTASVAQFDPVPRTFHLSPSRERTRYSLRAASAPCRRYGTAARRSLRAMKLSAVRGHRASIRAPDPPPMYRSPGTPSGILPAVRSAWKRWLRMGAECSSIRTCFFDGIEDGPDGASVAPAKA